MRKVYHKLVKCKDCGKEWLKNANSIKKWKGRCGSCAGKLTGGLSAPPKVKCEQCDNQTPSIHQPCILCRRKARGSTFYYHKHRVEVECKDCHIKWQKSRYTLSKWTGRCHKCAQIFESNKPERKALQSRLSREQVLRQGGIPNGRKFTSEMTKGGKNFNWKGGICKDGVPVECSKCGKEWNIHHSNYLRWKGTCLTCFNKNRVFTDEQRREYSKRAKEQVLKQGGIPNARKFDGSQTGEKSSNWKGGITPETTTIRHCAKYKEWRTEIFKRDDYICQICKVRGGKLHADHHPTPFCKLFDDFKKSAIEDYNVFTSFWNIDNGRTLCEECHYKHGWRFRKETRDDLFG